MPDAKTTLEKIGRSIRELGAEASHGRLFEEAARWGGSIQDAGERGIKKVREWWQGGAKKPARKATASSHSRRSSRR